MRCARARRLARGSQAVRLGRGVHHVAEALDGDVGLLEFLPQADQAQQRLAHAAGEHLEGHQHADGEAVVLHHQQAPTTRMASVITCSRPLASTL
jgi:hypothetical protein